MQAIFNGTVQDSKSALSNCFRLLRQAGTIVLNILMQQCQVTWVC